MQTRRSLEVARSRQDRNFYIIWVVIFVLLSIPGLVMFYKGHTSDPQHVDSAFTPWRNVIERAIDVNEFENDTELFVTVHRFLSTTEVEQRGVAAPQVETDSPEQFAQLVPGSERIYVENSIHADENLDNCRNGFNDSRYWAERRYYAFIENRSGVMLYIDTYNKPCFKPVDFDESGIHWQEITHNQLRYMIIGGFFLAGIPLFIACCIIYTYFYGYGGSRYRGYYS